MLLWRSVEGRLLRGRDVLAEQMRWGCLVRRSAIRFRMLETNFRLRIGVSVVCLVCG